MSTLNLPGLRAHHPLGFLAACGVLRVAHNASQNEVRLGWSVAKTGFGERMATIQGAARDSLIKLVAESAGTVVNALKNLGTIEAEAPVVEFRSNVRRAREDPGLRPAFDLLSSSASDIVRRRKTTGKHKGKLVVATTHLAMTSGQQDLLSGVLKTAGKLAKRSSSDKIPSSVWKGIEKALFGPWTYEDDEHSLGWDPNVQRLHALRNMAPGPDTKRRSVCAAVFLATQALPLFPCFAVGSRLRTTGFHRDDDEDWFSWPVWSEAISLDTLRSLLAQPFSADLRQRGVEIVYRCRRSHTGGTQGNYQVFSHAEERPWSRPGRRLPRDPWKAGAAGS